ncbi:MULTISPECIES: hypothetical protein [Gordonia]|uniref:Streptomyces killer toxin-like beta/gamma crystallin domain-containing protein n=3 Tax=Gordoniaceae TaxID=85026 RepID=L7LI55_9ACTN|nr:hypothetical protein [Gordonia sp. YC-JH1]KXT58627.1 hypothetical protein Y710_01775 [Gordonia sp. QH-12]MBY4571671.1 hypothetical protein [Gordonia sihwensis]GAC60800.1 hypothetical protein GSI01S_12_00340 [Gordonia sihwensis NBRC 108236]
MMRNPIRSTTRIAAAVAIAASVAVGAGAVSAGEAAADGFPNGPYCNGPAKVLAESAWSQVAICPVQGPTGWEYSGKGKVTGNTIDLWGATQNGYGFHAYNNGYTYHVHRDRLLITGPNGGVVSNEPWISYMER